MKTMLSINIKNLLVIFLLAGIFSCSNKSALTEANELPPAPTDEANAPAPETTTGVHLANVIFDSIEYVQEPKHLTASFIKEFGDGTVVDKVMIRKIDDDKKSKPTYYMVGIGQNNGSFRMMALELHQASDNSLYLTKGAIKHLARAVNCPFCYFSYEENEIMGVSCADNDGHFECIYTTSTVTNLISKK